MRYYIVFLDGYKMGVGTRQKAEDIQQGFEYGLGEACWIVPYREHWP
jgi:hypothetical protein